MKKVWLCVAALLSTLFVAGCDFFEIETCEHEYGAPSVIQPTCEEEGLQKEVCTLCAQEKETPLLALGHFCLEYQTITPTCDEAGGKLGRCERCGEEALMDIQPALGHAYGGWTVVSPATEVSDGVKERRCSRCSAVETGYITSISYVDLSVIQEPFDEGTRYSLSSYEQLLKKFRAAVLHQADKLACTLSYEYGDLSTLLEKLVDDCNLEFAFQVSVRALGEEFTFTFTHQAEPSKKTERIYYEQYDSLNYAPVPSNRGEDFDDFKINDARYSFTVRTTEQLCYVLERGVKPVCVAGSTAERAFAELKKILVATVDDSMSDGEKVKAIHDYLVMKVTYDGELYDKLGSGGAVNDYNGFYLEGVLFDQVAVCEGISKAFTALCNMEGIPCVGVTGKQTQNPLGVGHAWNKVYVDGKWYIVDATSNGTIVNEEFEILSYESYMVSEGAYEATYTGENYTDLLCVEDYDVYADGGFVYGQTEYDFVIGSQAELNALVAYFESFGKTKFTVEFKLDFDVGGSVQEELQEAYRANGLNGSFHYLEKDDVCTLIK